VGETAHGDMSTRSKLRRRSSPERAGESAPPVVDRSPSAAVLNLQRTAGNRATTALMRDKTKTRPAHRHAGIACTVDADGTIRTADGKDVIGFRAADGAAFATPAPAARMGTLETPDGTRSPLVRLQEVTLADESGTTRFVPKRKGRGLGVLEANLEAAGVVIRGGTPVAPADMPASLRDKVKLGTRISLAKDGAVWRLVDFPSRDRKTVTPTWVLSNHDRREFGTRRDEIRKEIANLPDELATGVEDDLDILAMVSIIEGPWRAKSPSWDKMASLGVFQWGAKRSAVATTGSSLGKFYEDLEERADAAAKKAAKDRSDADDFYVDAWKEATDAGLSIAGGKLRLAGKDATGGQIEAALAGPMGSGKLRAYQLVAAKAFLDELRAKTVRPITYGATLLHPGYVGRGPAITHGDRKIVLSTPAWATTIGAVCTSKKALALMANLLVNRPAWTNTAVWRALAPADAADQAHALVAQLIAAQDAAEAGAAPPAGAKRRRRRRGKPDITAGNAADPAAYKALQELVWPRLPGSVPQGPLTERLYTISLELYRIEHTTPTAETRAKRLVTTEVID
jgi:hypothetical protein